MTTQKSLPLERLSLRGLTLAPSQVWGAVRLVPVLRPEVRGDLRLALRSYGSPFGVVDLGGREAYTAAFLPHAFVVDWTPDGTPVATFGGRLDAADGKSFLGGCVRVLHRMAKREGEHRLRILPLHLAMEGFLDLHFGGPDIAWTEYSRQVMSWGLSPRVESGLSGYGVPFLEDALRVFEIHEGQVGVLLFVADAFASAFVVPHPEDYRALHRTLLTDCFCELLARYGTLYPHPVRIEATIDDTQVQDLAGLRAAVETLRLDWASFQAEMACGLLACDLVFETVRKMKPFRLVRFRSQLTRGEEHHIGEAILREDGGIEYLKSYRLSDAQAKRGFLLVQLSEHGWNIDATAAALKSTREELVLRLEKAGFGYLLKEHVLEAARRQRGR